MDSYDDGLIKLAGPKIVISLEVGGARRASYYQPSLSVAAGPCQPMYKLIYFRSISMPRVIVDGYDSAAYNHQDYIVVVMTIAWTMLVNQELLFIELWIMVFHCSPLSFEHGRGVFMLFGTIVSQLWTSIASSTISTLLIINHHWPSFTLRKHCEQLFIDRHYPVFIVTTLSIHYVCRCVVLHIDQSRSPVSMHQGSLACQVVAISFGRWGVSHVASQRRVIHQWLLMV